jgi:hypothetical protein
MAAAILFFSFWRCASRYLKPFVSTYLGLALWLFWMALFSAAFHFL